MGGNYLNICIGVLHTGKRWFIICPVEETPTSSQETPSEGTTTQSPGSSATAQHADTGTARPPASRGGFHRTTSAHYLTALWNNSTAMWQQIEMQLSPLIDNC